uniref:Uncharacterized protein n=1 Tax=Anopheles atroparvus TaxID=41427 RepID=A0A182JKF1_ANOAO
MIGTITMYSMLSSSSAIETITRISLRCDCGSFTFVQKISFTSLGSRLRENAEGSTSIFQHPPPDSNKASSWVSFYLEPLFHPNPAVEKPAVRSGCGCDKRKTNLRDLPVSGIETLVSRFERNPRMLVTTFCGEPVAPNSELPSFESRAFDSPAAPLGLSPEAATVTGSRSAVDDGHDEHEADRGRSMLAVAVVESSSSGRVLAPHRRAAEAHEPLH